MSTISPIQKEQAAHSDHSNTITSDAEFQPVDIPSVTPPVTEQSTMEGFLLSIRSLRLECKVECLSAWRNLGFVLPTLFFPFVFYTFFGVIFNKNSMGGLAPTYLMVTYAVFGVMGPALFGFGANVANERDKGWLVIRQVSPMSVVNYILAKMVMAMMFAFIIVCGLYLIAGSLGNVALPKSQWLSLIPIFILGTLPFCALGLAIGFWVKGSGAIAVVNLVYLPMGFLSGLWIPLQLFPQWIQTVGYWLPPYHLAELGLDIIGMGQAESAWIHVAVLLAYTLLFSIIGVLGYRHNKG
jgi:ABC-2 type transport system permease protein